MNFLKYIFSLNYLPHEHCFLGDKATISWYVIGNLGVFLAYMLIPLALYSMVKKTKLITSYKTIILLFAAFIFSCGISHLWDIIGIWYPFYRAQSYWLVWTAFISLLTWILLISAAKKVKINTYKIFDKSVQVTEIQLPPKPLTKEGEKITEKLSSP
jgi:hypothetical protein